MGVTTIPWCHFTFNGWWGCDHVSPACDHCYAEAWAKRTGFPELWRGQRRFFGDKHWREPLKWNKAAVAEGVRYRVFAMSMADVFDNHPEVEPHRQRLWDLIKSTPNLDWMLLTKRIGNAKRMLPPDWGAGYANAWIGATLADQGELERDVVKLLAVPARVHFISHEPGLGPLDLEHVKHRVKKLNVLRGALSIDLVITGGESGGKARPYNIQWAREIVDQCRRNHRAAFVKQLGARPYLHVQRSIEHSAPGIRLSIREAEVDATFKLRHRAGEDMAEWPADLRVRQFPCE